MYIINKLKQLKRKKEWRNKNTNNYTTLLFPTDFEKVSIGNATYGELAIYNNNTNSSVSVGHYCSIAPNVSFLVGSDHRTDCISTYPFRANILQNGWEALSKGDIIVDDDVWIGYGAIILSGVHIGQGAVVAAGAVVNHDVPPYAIEGGVPARLIKYRFTPSVMDYLLTFDYSKLDEQLIRDHVDELYRRIDNLELDEVKKVFSWFPKKTSEKKDSV